MNQVRVNGHGPVGRERKRQALQLLRKHVENHESDGHEWAWACGQGETMAGAAALAETRGEP
jgi:hypothetical protein